MKRNAYADTTIAATGKRLRHLEANTDLTQPEKVKTYIANKECSSGFKETLIETYDLLMKSLSQKWEKPFYQRDEKQPKIPTEEKINMLISKAQPTMALFLSMSRDLGTRPIELTWLKVKDLDLEKGNVSITSAKHCVGRTIKLKSNTLGMLRTHINKKNLSLTDKIFPRNSANYSELYRRLRNKLAEKLQEPAFKTIRLCDFRHFKATMEYHRTKDLLHVKAILGHKDLRTTLHYTQLIETLENDEYHCKTATTIEEAKNLIENGFEYHDQIDGIKLYRKRK
jgi:hypothetical protein